MPQPPTVAELWSRYSREELPANTPPYEVEEARRTFYAGASALLSGLMEGLDGLDEPTDRDIDNVMAVAAELREFAAGAARPRH